MDSRRSQPQSGTDFVRQAETLIRSLSGVLHARVNATPTGIDAIHVVAADDDAAASMAGHVRSALLAGLATPVVPTRIHVRTGALTAHAAGTAAPANHADPSTPRDRLRLIYGDDSGVPERSPDAGLDLARIDDPDTTRPRPHVARARLVAVDVRKPDEGRVVCRVSIAWNDQVHRAEAVAMDLPGAAAQAAAQAAVRALVSAGIDGLELSGLREVEIAGKDYVLVALRRHDGPTVRHHSGSALMFGTAERSAADAAVDAANELI